MLGLGLATLHVHDDLAAAVFYRPVRDRAQSRSALPVRAEAAVPEAVFRLPDCHDRRKIRPHNEDFDLHRCFNWGAVIDLPGKLLTVEAKDQ